MAPGRALREEAGAQAILPRGGRGCSRARRGEAGRARRGEGGSPRCCLAEEVARGGNSHQAAGCSQRPAAAAPQRPGLEPLPGM